MEGWFYNEKKNWVFEIVNIVLMLLIYLFNVYYEVNVIIILYDLIFVLIGFLCF